LEAQLRFKARRRFVVAAAPSTAPAVAQPP
jgi:hypothetical protein